VKLAITAQPAHVYEFGDFRLDAGKTPFVAGGCAGPADAAGFETLVYLVEHRDIVLDKERLMEAVWPDSIVEENNLTQNISTLRRVFGETPGSHHYIVTVPGRGYRFVADVKMGEAASSPGENGTEPVASVAQPDRRHRFRPTLLAIAAVLAVSLATLFSGAAEPKIHPTRWPEFRRQR